jgi:hypothetical protein
METIKRWIAPFVFAMCMVGLAACANPQAVPLLTDEQVKQLLDTYPSSQKMYSFVTTLDEFNRENVDINKDGIPEILVDGKLDFFLPYLAVIGYSDGEWKVWFYQTEIGRYCADHRSSVVENVFVVDFLTCNGGSGLFDAVWKQYEVTCVDETCELVRQNIVWRDGVSGSDSALPLTETIKLPSDLEWVTSGGAMRFRPQPSN